MGVTELLEARLPARIVKVTSKLSAERRRNTASPERESIFNVCELTSEAV
jgi:hypothetical protein